MIKKTSETTPTMASVVNQSNNSTTDTYSCNYLNPVLAYDGSSSSEITLNTSTANYNFIEIIYTGADGSYSSSGRVPITQNMTISLINHSFRDNEGTVVFWVSTVLLAGNKLTPQTSKWAWYTNGSGYGISQGNYVNIKKVYLYK